MLHYDLAVLVMDWHLIEVPPPATLFEQLKEQLRIVASTNEAFVVLKERSFELQLNSVTFIQRFEKFG